MFNFKIDASQGWCTSEGDKKIFIRDDFYILASFDESNANPEYYVYVNQTETLYGTGYYYLTMLYTTQMRGMEMKNRDFNSYNTKGEYLTEWTFHMNTNQILSNNDASKYDANGMLKLADVTSLVLEQNFTNVLSSKLLIVCNIAPKIRVHCSDHNTIRVNLCELEEMADRSFCSHLFDKCYFINEYEFDPLEPEYYIRVCKDKPSDSANSNNSTSGDASKTRYSYEMYRTSLIITGWISMISTVLSLFFMLLTLASYFILDELRNLPGWNIINLTTALFMAQFSFFLGSLLNHLAGVCFVISLMTHYGIFF
jgi:hypothetical protein